MLCLFMTRKDSKKERTYPSFSEKNGLNGNIILNKKWMSLGGIPIFALHTIENPIQLFYRSAKQLQANHNIICQPFTAR